MVFKEASFAEISPDELSKNPSRLKEYPKDFGNAEAQEMAGELLRTRFQGITEVAPTSRYDDQRTHIDAVISAEAVRFAVDYTGTRNPREMQQKVRELVMHPLVRLHNDEGEATDAEEMFRIIIPLDIMELGRAYNVFLESESGAPIDHLSDADRECIKIAEHVVRQITQLPDALALLNKPKEFAERVMMYAGPVKELFLSELARLKQKKGARAGRK